MSLSDTLTIIGIAAACAVLTGMIGLVIARATRRWSLRWQIAILTVSAVGGAYAGTLAVAQMMFLSGHDLTVMTLVSSVAAVIAIGIALVVGEVITRWSGVLHDQVRSMGDGTRVSTTASAQAPREVAALADQLAATQRSLADARHREVRLEESRRELVSWVSHDLRTPLAGMRAMAEALEDGMVDDPHRYHAQIRTEVDRMATMVDDLFELSRIQAGVLTLVVEPVSLGDLVSEALAGADPVARARQVRLAGRVEDDIEIVGDPAGLARVVSNLLMNAIRHTPADGLVEINGRTAGNGVELAISDGCGGLRPEEMERVFDLGWQGSPARSPEGQGAGLGLAIVKGIVEAHRGTVRVSNLEASSGCRFLITLPA